MQVVNYYFYTPDISRTFHQLKTDPKLIAPLASLQQMVLYCDVMLRIKNDYAT